MERCVRIRGIYSTALTKIFLDEGFRVVDPSPEILKRFNLKIEEKPPISLSIRDRRTKQGIYIEGDFVDEALDVLKKRLFDLIVQRVKETFCKVEFPYLSKRYLDEVRRGVLPTINNHHRLRIITGDEVTKAETGEGEKANLNGLLYEGFKKEEKITLEHVKVDGKKILLSPGTVLNFDHQKKSSTLLRTFRGGGVYDGLGMKIEEGDFCVTVVREGSFCLIHSYYTKDKTLKGRLYSFNTPIEFYPSRIRYIDLELDVVETNKKRIVDIEEFERIFHQGFITKRLRDKIMELAKKVVES